MNRDKFIGVVLLIASMTPLSAIAQSLPLKDGVYLRNTQWCPLYFHNELDFIDFEVEKNGTAFGFIEQGCTVSSVDKIDDYKVLAKAQCFEGGESFKRNIIFEIHSDQIRINDGQSHHLCKYAPYMGKLTKQDLSELIRLQLGLASFSKVVDIVIPTISPVKIQVEKRPDGFIEIWHEHDENCRGGSGDDPNTDIACEKRYDLTQKLSKFGWCYGKEDQSSVQYEWHACEVNSIQ